MKDRKEYKRQWYQKNKDRINKYRRNHYAENRIKFLEHVKKYRAEHREQTLKIRKRYYGKNSEKRNKESRIYYYNNLEYFIRWRKGYRHRANELDKERHRIDLKYNISKKISRAMCYYLKKSKNGRTWSLLVDYTLDDLKKHLEKTIPIRYCWQDYLEGKLHIDHIIPASVFNYTKPEHLDFQRCWALNNLRLLPAKENLEKRAKLSKPFQPCLKI